MKKKTTRTITNHADEKVQVTFTVDFTNCTKEELVEWALSNRVISGQKVWRDLSKDELKANVDGQVFNAKTIGQKVESKDKKVKKIMDVFGVDKDIATMIVDDPEGLTNMVQQLKNETKK